MKGYLLRIIKIILLLLSLAATTADAKDALLVNINGIIGPATENLIAHAITQAAHEQDEAVILQLNTPGGYISSTHNINQLILTSSVPIVTYVAPANARVDNAGIYILYASHIAAMAPDTIIGPRSNLITDKDKAKANIENNINQNNLSEQEKEKINANSVYIQHLAVLRGRNSVWADNAVRNAASLTADDALSQKVIDAIAASPVELLQKINGKQVAINDSLKTLDTQNLTLKNFKPDWRNQFLAAITDPNIAYILFLIGIYALFFEFFHPGIILPGLIGIVSLIISLYAFQMLPINYAGFALLVLGITFMIIEVQLSSFGILGIGGIVAFVIGSILLLDVNSPGYRIAWSLIVSMTIISALFFMILITLAARNRHRKIMTGREAMLGYEGNVIEIFNSEELLVRVQGELWKASSSKPVKKGQKIRIYGLSGLTLLVEPVE